MILILSIFSKQNIEYTTNGKQDQPSSKRLGVTCILFLFYIFDKTKQTICSTLPMI